MTVESIENHRRPRGDSAIVNLFSGKIDPVIRNGFSRYILKIDADAGIVLFGFLLRERCSLQWPLGQKPYDSFSASSQECPLWKFIPGFRNIWLFSSHCSIVQI